MKRLTRIVKWVAVVVLVLAVLGCAIPYLISIDQPAPPEQPFPNSSFIEVDGVRIHYRVWSPSPAPVGNVLLVHGFCGSTFSWRKNVDAFVSEGFRVVAVDLPPFGYSDRGSGIDHSAASRAKRCWGLADTVVADGTWILFGHSMGGGVIGSMAQQRPGGVAGLVFVDGATGMRRASGGTLGERVFTGMTRLGPVRRWTEVVAKYRLFQPDHIQALLTGAYGAPADSDAVDGYLAALRVPGTASGILDMFSAREPMPAETVAITSPALIIWGESDAWIPLRVGKTLHERIPGSSFVSIAGAGHCPMETHSEAFNASAIAFMKSCSGVS